MVPRPHETEGNADFGCPGFKTAQTGRTTQKRAPRARALFNGDPPFPINNFLLCLPRRTEPAATAAAMRVNDHRAIGCTQSTISLLCLPRRTEPAATAAAMRVNDHRAIGVYTAQPASNEAITIRPQRIFMSYTQSSRWAKCIAVP